MERNRTKSCRVEVSANALNAMFMCCLRLRIAYLCFSANADACERVGGCALCIVLAKMRQLICTAFTASKWLSWSVCLRLSSLLPLHEHNCPEVSVCLRASTFASTARAWLSWSVFLRTFVTALTVSAWLSGVSVCLRAFMTFISCFLWMRCNQAMASNDWSQHWNLTQLSISALSFCESHHRGWT